MPEQTAARLFRQSSTTYFVSSLFFPPAIRDEVFVLYAFVRTADNFVDAAPQNGRGLAAFERAFWLEVGEEGWLDQLAEAEHVLSADDRQTVAQFAKLYQKYDFVAGWVRAFFLAMRADLYKKRYRTLDETCAYMYGSAEVIGLMLARMFSLPAEALHAARMLGRAMQYANMIRDVAEDTQLGRQYLPVLLMERAGLSSLDESHARENERAFEQFIREQIELFLVWQEEAEQGYRYLPKRIRVPVATAGSMYVWATEQIAQNPLIVFEKKVKPSPRRVMLAAIKNMV